MYSESMPHNNPRTPAPNKFVAKALHKAGALRDGDAKMKDLAAPKKDAARARSHRPKLINEIKGEAGPSRAVNVFPRSKHPLCCTLRLCSLPNIFNAIIMLTMYRYV